ncbi:CK2 family regulatory subunit [Blastocystis sp. subtype 4]|uniref:CK2 family regulatory subunit n=1 Tax=Blastocystis sp. subtype 4 TaxID=944170 RepID=UPI000711F642|nr:CK2 family regulatory subunit [Blastocystis sp. subtype 4]KNB42238.1 CK2 family regulatory subunit [Blastocystis sp. subtype 4]|eukprot:XP_014525681.1 CK2 family regulatory subunit [Blastocystis sp. subtype 4]
MSSNGFPEQEPSDYESKEGKTWISKFCSKEINSYFCEVEEEFITDAFNIYNISRDFHLFKHSLAVILDADDPEANDAEIDQDELQTSTTNLYGMIHARYIVTASGLEAMLRKYKSCAYGTCPRVYCNNQNLLPIGESDLPNVRTVKLFCPCCKEIYYPPKLFDKIDGAFFGTSFPHVFLLNYPELMVNHVDHFEPKIYGYKIHESR